MRKIVVLDDDPSVRALLDNMLTLEGFEVHTAGDGPAGLQLIAHEKPDCVILDVMMPGMDGHAVLERLRALSGTAERVPVVMLTAAADDNQTWRAWQGGVDYFLAKPFEIDELVRCLDRLCASTPVAI